MTPQERGHFVHNVFESFFTEWQRLGHGAITTTNVGDAIAVFDAWGGGERRQALQPDLPPLPRRCRAGAARGHDARDDGSSAWTCWPARTSRPWTSPAAPRR